MLASHRIEEFAEAFRSAVGITYRKEQADAREKRQKSSILAKAGHAIRTFGGSDEDSDRRDSWERYGFSRLRDLCIILYSKEERSEKRG